MHQTYQYQNRVNSEINYLLICFFPEPWHKLVGMVCMFRKRSVKRFSLKVKLGFIQPGCIFPYSARFGDSVFYGDYLLDVVA